MQKRNSLIFYRYRDNITIVLLNNAMHVKHINYISRIFHLFGGFIHIVALHSLACALCQHSSESAILCTCSGRPVTPSNPNANPFISYQHSLLCFAAFIPQRLSSTKSE